MRGWKCKQCGTIHTQNPGHCRNCSTSILKPVSASELQNQPSATNAPDSIDPSQTVGTAVEPDYESSPDVAVDGSIKNKTSSDQGSSESDDSFLLGGIFDWLR